MVRRELESPSVLSVIYVDTVLVFLNLLIAALSLMFFHAENFTETLDARLHLAIGVH